MITVVHAPAPRSCYVVLVAAALLVFATSAYPQTPSERCAAAQREAAERRQREAAQRSAMPHDRSRRVCLVPVKWAPETEAVSDSTEAVSTFRQYPLPWAVATATIIVCRTADFQIDLLREDNSLIATYDFEKIGRGEYAFDLPRADSDEPTSARLQVRVGDRLIGRPQPVYLGPR